MSKQRHIPRWAFWLIVGIVIFVIMAMFTLIGTGQLENAAAATKPKPAPPPPVLNLIPPTSTGQSSTDDGSEIDSSSGDVEDDNTPPPADQVAGAPQVAQTGTTASSNAGKNPQAVTTPTSATPGAVTAKTTTPAVTPKPPPVCSNLPELLSVPATMDRSPSGVCALKCLNHPDYTYVPDGLTKDAAGNCLPPRGPDNYGLCKGDRYKLVSYPDVDTWLNDGYSMGIIVDTPDPNYRLNCLISDLATYRLSPGGFVFSGMYVQDGWPNDGQEFDNPLPFPWSAWKPLYPLWVHKTAASQYVANQSTASIMAYGLLWYNGNRYQSANSFAKYLKKNKTSWRSWKKHNPRFAALLLTHQRLLRH